MHRINNVQLNQSFPGAKVYCKIKGCENFNLNTWSTVFGALYKMEINIVTWKWGGGLSLEDLRVVSSQGGWQHPAGTLACADAPPVSRLEVLRWLYRHTPGHAVMRGSPPCSYRNPQAAHLSIVQTVGLYKSSLRPYGRSYSHPALF